MKTLKTLLNTTMLVAFVFTAQITFAQDGYFTIYNFSVENKDVETVAKIANDYFTMPRIKAEGVTVYLYENHFNDKDFNFTHSIVFLGTLDAMGNQYSPTGGVDQEKFQAFLTKINQFTTAHSSASGRRLLTFGSTNQTYPVQNQNILKVKDAAKFAAAWKKYQEVLKAENVVTILGEIKNGRSPLGETHYVLRSYPNFKDALKGVEMPTDKTVLAARSLFYNEIEGNVEVVRTTTRVLLGKW